MVKRGSVGSDVKDIFLSYNHVDEKWVEKLAKRIEKESFQGRRLSTWFAPWDIDSGNVVLKIEEGIMKSRFFAPVMTSEWAKSGWATLERTMAVYRDPAGTDGRIIPILLRDCEIPLSLQVQRRLDYRASSNFARETKKLIAILKGESLRPTTSDTNVDTPIVSTLAIAPDKQKELLVSNLFPVLRIPDNIFLAKSDLKRRKDVFEMIRGSDPPPFGFIEEGRGNETGTILSFANPKMNELKAILSDEIVRTVTADYCLSNLYTTFIDLLNRCNTKHAKAIGLFYDYKSRTKKNFFLPNDQEPVRRVRSYNSSIKRKGRIVVKFMGEGEPFYIHRSCKTTFTTIENKLYLRIIPGWHFTTNGMDPVDKRRMGSLSAQWMNLERNRAVLDDLRFWVRVYANGIEKDVIKSDNALIAMDTGGGLIQISIIPALASIGAGIYGDYRESLWQKEKEDEDLDEIKISDENVATIDEEEEDEEE